VSVFYLEKLLIGRAIVAVNIGNMKLSNTNSIHSEKINETPPSFARDIAPLFTPKDVNCMRIVQNDRGQNIILNDYGYMGDATGDGTYTDHSNARHVYAHLTGEEKPQMPMGSEKKWNAPDNPDGQSALMKYQTWMEQGFQP
jgi:hypothetical protein